MHITTPYLISPGSTDTHLAQMGMPWPDGLSARWCVDPIRVPMLHEKTLGKIQAFLELLHARLHALDGLLRVFALVDCLLPLLVLGVSSPSGH